ncbi:hypothetical protein DEU56DRAFT_764765 [Suillus clintonianus]|uniref:uncharacterized protein n=1 Tax=Suillus clintonianus TaxID=1904413 RepID=UPI001B86C4EE|nr:uncharacterized protein DEU56DRAFT_764765 [Suillus clintonianus]KAG2157460.1 hypothetical protein DEU56DRAFT_764765 [Suillus clintonianus]
MFEEICLTCSKHLRDDGRAYCSDECENSDMYNSPSISSASSALSSPYIGFAPGGEVPALMPSALGTALSSNFQKRGRYSVSSSSTSSASWSVFTDAEEEGYASVGIDDEASYEGDGLESGVSGDGFARSQGFLHPCKPSGLSYTRQPSATNNRSTIPLLHRRTSSTSSSGLGQAHYSAEDDADSMSDVPFHEKSSEQEREHNRLTVTSRFKKTRNRASLPAYFSLLQVSSPQHSSPPLSTSSGNTVNRASPPTPKLASLLAVSGIRHALEATPRGRRREPDTSRSNSRSRARQQTLVPGPRERQDSYSSVEKVFDWTCAPLPRGRPSVRRNSSPLPKMISSIQQFEETPFVNSDETHERRGRFKRNELGGPSSRDAPGYGNGRSGLRERVRERQRGVGASPL